MFGDLVIVIEVFDEINGSILIEIMQTRDFVTTTDINRFLQDFQSQWLKQPRGNALPGQIVEGCVDSTDKPDVSVPGADSGCVAVLEKIKSAQSHPRVTWHLCLCRKSDFVHGESPLIASQFSV